MKECKRIILLAAFVVLSLTAHAQHFDWVKTFTGPSLNTDDVHRPVSSVTDSDGNIYIIGQFTPGARIEGIDLLPITGANRMCVLIAKFTPSGNMAWHKSIYSQYDNCLALDIRKQGDSSITALVSFRLPHGGSISNSNKVYYLDTLLTTNDNYLMVTDSIANFTTNAFITFDHDGNLMEQHFLQMAYIDSTGVTLRESNTGGMPNDNRIITSTVTNEMFNIDDEGNIYICRRAIDTYSWYNSAINDYVDLTVENGGIAQIRIIVDGQRSLYVTPSYRSDHRNQQILKFSPHFNSLIDAVYVFDSLCIPQELYTDISVSSFEKGIDDNFYLSLGGWNYPDTMYVSRSDSLRCISNSMTAFDACMIEYSTDLTATRVVQITCTADPLDIPKAYYFHGTTYDEETNSIYLLGSVQKDPLTIEDPDCWITYREDTLDLNRNLFWLRIDPFDNSLIAYGKARTNNATRIKQTDIIFQQSNIVVNNNRVFSQVGFQGDIFVRDSSINIGTSEQGIGVMCWDTDGHEIGFIDYNAISPKNKTGRLHLNDSCLYLTGIVASSADLGELHIDPIGGRDQAYIACYVDTAFMTPYVYIDPRAEQSIEWEQELSFPLSASPIALTATASSGLPVSYSCTDTSIAKVVGSFLYLFSAGTTTVTAYQNGSQYGYYPATPITKNLTGEVSITLVEGGNAFVAYPNPFRQSVRIKVQGGQLKEHNGTVTAILTDISGRREEVHLTPDGAGRYSLDLTSRPQATYLLTLTTADGKTHTVRLMKMSDIFTR